MGLGPFGASAPLFLRNGERERERERERVNIVFQSELVVTCTF
jgi:hypothetical protein